MGDFFGFKKMVSAVIIKFMYTIGAIIITIAGIGLLFMKGEESLYGLLILIFGNIFWRILCEGWIIFFSLHERIASIENNLEENSS